MIIYLAGLQTLPQAVLDAARLDRKRGHSRDSSRLRCRAASDDVLLGRRRTDLGPFRFFDFVNLMTQGGPSNASNVLVYFAYQNGFAYLQLGTAAAISLIMFALVLLILGAVAWAFNR